MSRPLLILFFLFAWSGFGFSQNSLNESQKRDLFLKAREDIHPVPAPSPKPANSPKPKPSPTKKTPQKTESKSDSKPDTKTATKLEPKAEPKADSATKKSTPQTPPPAKKETPEKPKKDDTPKESAVSNQEKVDENNSNKEENNIKPIKSLVKQADANLATDYVPPEAIQQSNEPKAAATPLPSLPATPSPTPALPPIPAATPLFTPEKSEKKTEATVRPTPKPASRLMPRFSTPTPRPKKESVKDAEVTIEKSGRQEDEGFLPAPSQKRGFGRRWTYLSDSVRRAIDQAPVRKGRWKYIIIHNSATRQGNAAIFDNYHRRVRKMENGMAYHFVIGNGSSSGNGQIEIGNRWTRQINGGHVASDYLNDISLGICLVGDYDRDLPTAQQMAALKELLTYLRARVGKIKGQYSQVRGHREINPKPTTCPGKRFPIGVVRREYP